MKKRRRTMMMKTLTKTTKTLTRRTRRSKIAKLWSTIASAKLLGVKLKGGHPLARSDMGQRGVVPKNEKVAAFGPI